MLDDGCVNGRFYLIEKRSEDDGPDGMTSKEGSTSDASAADAKRRVRLAMSSTDSCVVIHVNNTDNGGTTLYTAHGKQ